MTFSKVKIKDVCDFIGGSQPPKEVFINQPREGYIRLIQTRDYKSDNYITYIPKHLARRFCSASDIMIGRYGPPIFQILRGLDGAYNVALMKAVPKANVLNDYLYYILKQPSIFEYVDKLSKRTGGQTGVDLDSLNEYPVLLPTLNYQEQVLGILKGIDDKISLNNRINTELEAMAKTIYDYWFVQFDFPISKEQSKAMGKPRLEGKSYKASGGKMVWSEELKREVPEGWAVKELSNVTSFLSRGISPSYLENGGVCVLNQKCIRDKSVNFEPSRRHDDSIKNASAKQVRLYDVLVNSTGVGTLGRVAIFKRMKEAFVTVDSHVTIVRADSSLIDPIYFGFSMLEKQEEIERFSQGSTGQVELSRSQLENLRIVVPSKPLQKEFNEFYGPILQKLAALESENEKLTQFRDWLLPILMNGQVKIGEAVQSKVIDATKAKSDFMPESIYDYQSQLFALIADVSKQNKIKHGEMTIAKYAYLIDRVKGIPTFFDYGRHHLGPWAKEMKKVLLNKKNFKIDDEGISVVNRDLLKDNPYEKQIKEAILELTTIINKYKSNERSHQTELLATVCKVVEDIKSTDVKAVRESMKNWPIDLKTSKFKNKAEKFSEDDTSACLYQIIINGWDYKLLNE